jgi:hypothetical protein
MGKNARNMAAEQNPRERSKTFFFFALSDESQWDSFSCCATFGLMQFRKVVMTTMRSWMLLCCSIHLFILKQLAKKSNGDVVPFFILGLSQSDCYQVISI